MERSLRLTGPEVRSIEIALNIIEQLATGEWNLPQESRTRRISEAVQSVRYLLERSEERRVVH